MTDWRAVALARGMTESDAEKLAPVLVALEATLVRMSADLPVEIEPATVFRAAEGDEA